MSWKSIDFPNQTITEMVQIWLDESYFNFNINDVIVRKQLKLFWDEIHLPVLLLFLCLTAKTIS